MAGELVVGLPADHCRMPAEGAGDDLGDASAVALEQGVGVVGGLPSADAMAIAIALYPGQLGMGMQQPRRWAGGGRAQDHSQATCVCQIQGAAEPGSVKATVGGLEMRPGEIADAHGIESELLHQGEIDLHGGFVPQLGIPGRTKTQKRLRHARSADGDHAKMPTKSATDTGPLHF